MCSAEREKPVPPQPLLLDVVNSFKALHKTPRPLQCAKFKMSMSILKYAVQNQIGDQLDNHRGADLAHPDWCLPMMLASVQRPCMPPPHWSPSPGLSSLLHDYIAGKATVHWSSQFAASASIGVSPVMPAATGSQPQSAASQPRAAASHPRSAANQPTAAASPHKSAATQPKAAASSPNPAATQPTAAASHPEPAAVQPTAAGSSGRERSSQSAAGRGLEGSAASPTGPLMSSNPFSGTAFLEPHVAKSLLGCHFVACAPVLSMNIPMQGLGGCGWHAFGSCCVENNTSGGFTPHFCSRLSDRFEATSLLTD